MTLMHIVPTLRVLLAALVILVTLEMEQPALVCDVTIMEYPAEGSNIIYMKKK